MEERDALIKRLLQEIEELKAEVVALRKENTELKEEIKRLKGTNSGNSSKPHSTDRKKSKKEKPSIKGFNSLKQKRSHRKGITRTRMKNPDKIVECKPESCSRCGTSLENIAGKIKNTRQEIDIPEIKPIVTEFQTIEKRCSCGCTNTGHYPEDIKSHVQFGKNITAIATYLNTCQYIPFKRVTDILSDILGIEVSEGTLDNILKRASVKASVYTDEIKHGLKTSDWVGSDETGIRIGSENHYLWVWQNNCFSFYINDKSRSYKVIQDNFGEDFEGISLHDGYAGQNKTHAMQHQQCLPHIIRRLQALIDMKRNSWAYQLQDLFRSLIRAKKKRSSIPENIWEKIQNRAKWLLDSFLDFKFKDKDAERLRKSLFSHKKSLLTFLYHDVPADNNGSERAIRLAKIHKKISNCFRNNTSARRFFTILSVIQTAKKQGLNLFNAIKSILDQTLTLKLAMG